jgi:hypothetical protein
MRLISSVWDFKKVFILAMSALYAFDCNYVGTFTSFCTRGRLSSFGIGKCFPNASGFEMQANSRLVLKFLTM